MHYLTLTELHRAVDNTPGNEALADVLNQIIEDDPCYPIMLRVDLAALLRKPDASVGSLPPR